MRRDFEDLSGADPWAVLGVEREAGIEDVKRAYRQLVREAHPDSPTGDTERFKAVSLAFEILSEPVRASEYADRLRRTARQEPPTQTNDPAATKEEPTAAEDVPSFYTDPFDWREGPGPGTDSTTYEEPTWSEPEYKYETEPSPDDRIPPIASVSTSAPQYRFTPQPAWNRLAIISLAMTFFCFPVSLFTGFAALSQIRTTKERGAALAWTAIVLSVAPILFFCASKTLSG